MNNIQHSILLLLIYFLIFKKINGQNYDNNWIFGAGPINSKDTTQFRSYIVNFDNGFPDFILDDRLNKFDSRSIWNLSASNKEGNFIFSSDGFNIYNKEFTIMDNGDSINYTPEIWGYFYEQHKSYLSKLSGQFIPFPNYENLYIIFHLPFFSSRGNPSQGKSILMPLQYSIIDMNENKGLGKVLIKNETLINIPLSHFAITKHGNGRDWWVVGVEELGNRYFIYLVEPNGISGPFIQRIGKWFDIEFNEAPSKFSPDGNTLIRTSKDGIVKLSFDRCSGILFDDKFINFEFELMRSPNIEFSDNSQYLYISTLDAIYQINFNCDHLYLIPLVVNSGKLEPWPIENFYGQLVKLHNGKIYLANRCGCYSHYLIHNPNNASFSCNIESDLKPLNYYLSSALPVYPNYSLGRIEGSICDTVRVTNKIPDVVWANFKKYIPFEYSDAENAHYYKMVDKYMELYYEK